MGKGLKARVYTSCRGPSPIDSVIALYMSGEGVRPQEVYEKLGKLVSNLLSFNGETSSNVAYLIEVEKENLGIYESELVAQPRFLRDIWI